MRDDVWLFSKLDDVWDDIFPDVPQDNDVRIIWGRRARNRLGSIKMDPESRATIITINRLFKDPKIPEYVVIGTIAHELAHYAHGFHSPLTKRFQTPHAGGVVNRELKDRGLEEIIKKQKRWLKENWKNYLKERYPSQKRPKRRIIIKWI